MSPYREPGQPTAEGDSRESDLRLGLVVGWQAGVFVGLLLGLVAGTAHCQDRPTDEEVIARTFISEEGWDGDSGGWASLGAVIRWRAEEHHEGDLRAAAVALSPRLHDGCRVTTRLWRCDLSDDLHRPRHLEGRWESERAGGLPSRRDRWVAALAAARALLAGLLPDSCVETPHAWGSWADVAMRIRNGERWDDAGCPGRNRYGRRLVRR